jgi:hypothetical protein
MLQDQERARRVVATAGGRRRAWWRLGRARAEAGRGGTRGRRLEERS